MSMDIGIDIKIQYSMKSMKSMKCCTATQSSASFELIYIT